MGDTVVTTNHEKSAEVIVTNYFSEGLKVNASKSKITRPPNLKYLGFRFWKDGRAKEWKARPYQDSIKTTMGVTKVRN